MKILVTGAKGFIGKNLIATLNQKENCEVLEYDRENTITELKEFTKICDFVVNLAGVNRPTRPEEFYEGNAGFTETLCNLLRENGNKSPILISSSIHVASDNDYGKSKKEGEELLQKHGKDNDSRILIYRFANLFGKWCRPNYNSVTATWCYNVANDIDVVVNDPSVSLPLCYIDDVVSGIINAIDGNINLTQVHHEITPIYNVTLGELSETIKSFKSSRENLEIINMGNELTKKLYSTYLSYLKKNEFSYELKQNIDNRGSFTEFLKTDDFGQVSVNISKKGITKGNHWHHSKNEKFLVVSGKGVIRFRDINETEIIEYFVSGDKLEVVDIPTGYTHNISNLGDGDMVTIMWANEKFDANKPDTFFEEV